MTKIKATKKLTDIDFSGKNAAVALVGKANGGAANGFTSLLIKSAKYTDEHVEKAAKIRITMSIEDFLVKFYGLWYDDAEVLARALGFETKSDDTAETDSYEDYIASQVAAIEVLKGLEQSENVEKSLSELEPDDYLSLLKSQELLEKAFKKIDKGATNSKPTAKTVGSEEGTSIAVASAKEVEKAKAEDVSSSETKPTEKSKMTVKTVEQEVLVEMVEKSQFESIQKALEKQTADLDKALASVAQFEKEKAEAVQKSRKDLLTATVKDADKVEALFKGFANVESQAVFEDAVKALEAMMTAQKNSDLFKELGASTQAPKQDEDTPLMKAAKAAAAQAKSTK